MAAKELREVGQFFNDPALFLRIPVYLPGTGLYPSPLAQDADEFLRRGNPSQTGLTRWWRANQVHDGKTLAALLLANRSSIRVNHFFRCDRLRLSHLKNESLNWR